MLLFNGDGRHAISPDGTIMAIGDQSQEKRQSLIYVVPIGGGTPRKVTEKSPSYLHGWSPEGPEYSPDGKYIYFNSIRSGLMQL
jgi:Tol biopolymer transport system component